MPLAADIVQCQRCEVVRRICQRDIASRDGGCTGVDYTTLRKRACDVQRQRATGAVHRRGAQRQVIRIVYVESTSAADMFSRQRQRRWSHPSG